MAKEEKINLGRRLFLTRAPAATTAVITGASSATALPEIDPLEGLLTAARSAKLDMSARDIFSTLTQVTKLQPITAKFPTIRPGTLAAFATDCDDPMRKPFRELVGQAVTAHRQLEVLTPLSQSNLPFSIDALLDAYQEHENLNLGRTGKGTHKLRTFASEHNLTEANQLIEALRQKAQDIVTHNVAQIRALDATQLRVGWGPSWHITSENYPSVERDELKALMPELASSEPLGRAQKELHDRLHSIWRNWHGTLPQIDEQMGESIAARIHAGEDNATIMARCQRLVEHYHATGQYDPHYFTAAPKQLEQLHATNMQPMHEQQQLRAQQSAIRDDLSDKKQKLLGASYQLRELDTPTNSGLTQFSLQLNSRTNVNAAINKLRRNNDTNTQLNDDPNHSSPNDFHVLRVQRADPTHRKKHATENDPGHEGRSSLLIETNSPHLIKQFREQIELQASLESTNSARSC